MDSVHLDLLAPNKLVEFSSSTGVERWWFEIQRISSTVHCESDGGDEGYSEGERKGEGEKVGDREGERKSERGGEKE